MTAAQGDLLFFTSISSLDGTLFLLALNGTLSSITGILATGLGVTAGAGAWLSAHQGYGPPEARQSAYRTRLVLTALVAAGLSIGAVALAGAIGDHLTLRVVPKAAALALVSSGAGLVGVRLPRVFRVPLPIALVTGSLLAEGAVHLWVS